MKTEKKKKILRDMVGAIYSTNDSVIENLWKNGSDNPFTKMLIHIVKYSDTKDEMYDKLQFEIDSLERVQRVLID